MGKITACSSIPRADTCSKVE